MQILSHSSTKTLHRTENDGLIYHYLDKNKNEPYELVVSNVFAFLGHKIVDQ